MSPQAWISGLQRPAESQSLLDKGRATGTAWCPLPSSAEPPPGPGQAPGQRGDSAGLNDTSLSGDKAEARLSPRTRATPRVRPEWPAAWSSFSLLGSAEGGDMGVLRCPHSGEGGQQPQGAPLGRPELCCRGAPGPPHIRAPGTGRAGPRTHGLTCTARVKKMPASDASFFMLKSMAHRTAGRARPQRSLPPPARLHRPAPRPPAAGAPALRRRSLASRRARGGARAAGVEPRGPGGAGRGGPGRPGSSCGLLPFAALSRRLAGFSCLLTSWPLAHWCLLISLCPFAPPPLLGPPSPYFWTSFPLGLSALLGATITTLSSLQHRFLLYPWPW